MRNAIHAGTAEEARAILARAEVVHLATTGADGHPILRVLHAVLDGDGIAFHAAPAGEKMDAVGRPAVVSAHETVASIPSYFLDPERACPATTYYVAAQAHGRIEEVTQPEHKARILQALMEKYQPEGGHVRVDANDPLYRKAVDGLLVARVAFERVTAKVKLGQNRRPEERVRILERLWRRGAPGDARAVATIVSRFPDLPRPSFLANDAGVRLECDLSGEDVDRAVRLLDGAYWLHGIPPERIRWALTQSSALVGAKDEAGRLVAIARAVSDGRVAWVYDVMVAPNRRGSGVGAAVMKLLLDHPAVRSALVVRLGTRDAAGFYRDLGFVPLDEMPLRPYPVTEMIRTSR